MYIGPNKVVTMSYELRNGNAEGELLERMDNKYPFEFLFGNGNLLPAFEENLIGLSEKSDFEFILKSEEAYGMPNKDHIMALEKTLFVGEMSMGIPDIGEFVAMTNDQGQQFNGKVLSIEEETITVDFNHAMAGLDLHFSGMILHIRTAGIDEIQRGHHIPANGAHR